LLDAGYEVTWLDVDAKGMIDLSQLEGRPSGPDTAIVSLMWANNETGVPFPDRTGGRKICRKQQTIFHTDAVASGR